MHWHVGPSPDLFAIVLLDGLSATRQLLTSLFSLGEGETDAHADLFFFRVQDVTGIGIPTGDSLGLVLPES